MFIFSILKFVALGVIILMILGYFIIDTFVSQIFASDDFNIDYTITLSDTCIALLKINVTRCPSYADILTVFPDQTNQEISGAFNYSFGYYHREKSNFQNQYKFYEFYPIKNLIWVDPPHDVKIQSRNIIIAASTFDYKLPHESVDTTKNNTLAIGSNRYIDPKCNDAIITADNWLFLLGDTVRLMQHDCDKEFTNFDEQKIITWQRALHDVTTSYKHQLDAWTKKAIADCGKHYCIGN